MPVLFLPPPFSAPFSAPPVLPPVPALPRLPACPRFAAAAGPPLSGPVRSPALRRLVLESQLSPVSLGSWASKVSCPHCLSPSPAEMSGPGAPGLAAGAPRNPLPKNLPAASASPLTGTKCTKKGIAQKTQKRTGITPSHGGLIMPVLFLSPRARGANHACPFSDACPFSVHFFCP